MCFATYKMYAGCGSAMATSGQDNTDARAHITLLLGSVPLHGFTVILLDGTIRDCNGPAGGAWQSAPNLHLVSVVPCSTVKATGILVLWEA